MSEKPNLKQWLKIIDNEIIQAAMWMEGSEGVNEEEHAMAKVLIYLTHQTNLLKLG